MINNTNVENKYTTNGVLETVYPITFQGAVTDSGTPHLNIVLKTADGTSTRQLVYNEDYELVREEIDPSAPQTESMGIPPVIGIKLLNAEDAVAGNSLTITRDTPFTQDVNFQVGRIDPEQVENTADLAVLRDQELSHKEDVTKEIADEAIETAVEAKDIAQDAKDIADTFDDRLTQAEQDASDARQDASDAKDIAQDASDAVSAHITNTNNPHSVTAAQAGALPDTTKYGASLSLTVDSTTYVVTAQLKDQDGNNLGTAQTIDLPLESVVVSGAYDSATKEVVLTLQGGSTIRFSVADLVSGLQTEITALNMLSADLVDDTSTTHKFVTTTEKSTWNGKQDAISDLATIRSNAQAGKAASDTIATYGDIVTHDVAEFATAAQGAKADTALQAGDNVSELTNDAGYITGADITGKVNKTGDTMSGNLELSAKAGIYLEGIGQQVSTSTSRLNLGSPSNVYAYLTGNNQGAFGIYSEASGTRKGIACYPNQNFFADAPTKTIDLGRSNNVWKIVYGNSISDGTNTETTANIISGASAGATAVQPSDLATVATSGSYNDLSNKPTIPAAQVNSDWNANSGVAQILNKPTLATVATSGSYNDLSNKPTIPTVNNPTITITQGGITKGSFSLNQASGDTIALDAGGGVGNIDNITITANADDEIQTVAMIDQNSGIDKIWTGESADYEDIANPSNDTFYAITDDIGDSALEIGQITEALNDKVDKGHEVIEFQAPTVINGYTWYRLYADGWVEQGGLCSGTAENNPVTMPIEMSNTEYQILAIADPTDSVNGWGWIVVVRNTKTTTGFSLGGRYASGSVVPVRTHWQVSGMAA